MNASWITLREWDTRQGAAKGTAFRCFKRLRDGAVEGRDFRRLDALDDADEIRRLRGGNRIYANTVHVVLLSPAFAMMMASIAGKE
jgi:hypothetical protein